MVNGEPAPTVTWGRNKGEVDDPEKYKTRYDERAQEHILEVRKKSRQLMIHAFFCQAYLVKHNMSGYPIVK